jgi:hypothetical protein
MLATAPAATAPRVHVANSEPASSYYGRMSLAFALPRWFCRRNFFCLCSRGLELRPAL